MTTRAERTASVLRLLAEKLGLPEPPGRIEAYDISTTGASDIVAAMTVFADGKPKKSAYRYFLLRDLDGPDDYASMDQVISRRFKREIDGDERFARHPDLLHIDGGQPHAAEARRAMEQYGLDIPTFGMVKDDRHRTRALVTPEGREIGIQGAPALFAFIGQIQEETHRSAVGYHHKRHTKTGLGSALEKIPGIGPARRKQLLKSFGSVKAIRAASLPALMEVVPSAAARAVWPGATLLIRLDLPTLGTPRTMTRTTLPTWPLAAAAASLSRRSSRTAAENFSVPTPFLAFASSTA